jgi:hypothetical protein
MLYELVTGHPDRAPHELVFLADLAVELRGWPADTRSKVGVDPQATAGALVPAGSAATCRACGWRADRRGAAGLAAAGHDLRARSPTGSAAGSPARPGSGASRPAASRATAACSRGHPQAAAMSAADTNRPDTDRPDTDPADSARGSPASALRTPRWRHAGQPAAEPSTTTAAMSDGNGTAVCRTGQHPCLTARSLVWGGRKASVVRVRQRSYSSGNPTN